MGEPKKRAKMRDSQQKLELVTEAQTDIETKIDVPTFLKWAGGKKQLLEQFSKHLPVGMDTYVEPFLGGGAVLLYVLKYKHPKKCYAYDINKDLINVFLAVRDNPNKLINFLTKLQKGHNESKDPKKYYYERREEYNSPIKDKVKKAALFIYLNKACYNGLYRVNSLNEFNVPFGKYAKVNIFDKKGILDASDLLHGVIIKVSSFDKIPFPKKSVVYFDPPYWSENNGFTSYSSTLFGRTEQQKLRDLFAQLDKEGHKLILSNSNTSFIRTFYSGFNTTEVDARWMINCDGENRGKIKELLITNNTIKGD